LDYNGSIQAPPYRTKYRKLKFAKSPILPGNKSHLLSTPSRPFINALQGPMKPLQCFPTKTFQDIHLDSISFVPYHNKLPLLTLYIKFLMSDFGGVFDYLTYGVEAGGFLNLL
jgi:hypothetical protein